MSINAIERRRREFILLLGQSKNVLFYQVARMSKECYYLRFYSLSLENRIVDITLTVDLGLPLVWSKGVWLLQLDIASVDLEVTLQDTLREKIHRAYSTTMGSNKKWLTLLEIPVHQFIPED